MNKVKFQIGQLVATPGALELLETLDVSPLELVSRHVVGDWGDLCDEDKQANEEALVHGSRIFSAYETQGHKVWVITEADRSVTTVLLPEEY